MDRLLFFKRNRYKKNTNIEENEIVFLDEHKAKEFLLNKNVKVKTKPKLVVGPYQGYLACLTLKFPNGVCWNSVINNKSMIVENVEEFPGHIACDSRSKSEIVIPIYDKNNKLFAILDVDSNKFSSFDIIDKKWLEKITKDFLK